MNGLSLVTRAPRSSGFLDEVPHGRLVSVNEQVSPALDSLKRSLRSMVMARLFAVPWAFIQLVAYEQDYPEGHRLFGVVLVGVLAIANLAFAIGTSKIVDLKTAQKVAIGSLAFDIVLAMSFVLLLTFDPTSALWAVLFITILEGAILFQFVGAMSAWAAVTVLYAAREVWGSGRYDYPLLWNSITFRMGIGLIIALVSGLMARDLVRERKRLADALGEVTAIDGMRSALVSTMAHDIRNPLTSIRGAHRLLLEKGTDLGDEAVQRLLMTADRQSERLQIMATDLLDLARLERGRIELTLEELNVADEVGFAIAYLQDGVMFDIDIPEHLMVRADRARLQQIVMNLISNAETYGSPPFEIVGRASDGFVTLEFRDQGQGVPEEARSTLFAQFGTKSGRSSVGFGLSIVKAMAEAHGGTVTYEDNVPTGAIFRLSLPAPG